MAGSWTKRWAIAGVVVMLAAVSAALLLRSSMKTAPQGIGNSGAHPAPEPPAAYERGPGTDLPPIGRSLFDFLFTQHEGGQRVYRIPFPFAALLQKIERELARDDAQPSPLRFLLIPLGRSLQRNAAAPEFFRYPRAIVAVDGAPGTVAGAPGMLFKDRLYLGYHEKAAVIEVISYNEAAGRFEFQVVKDYRPGGKPQVLYASRILCTSCHQNEAPIFSRPSWAETNANRRVAARLREQSSSFFGFPAEQSIDVANAFDDATDRANFFASAQLFWREGCEAGADISAGIQCRASAFMFVLQYLLSGARGFDSNSARYRKDFLPVIARSWKEKWPSGIPVPSPDLTNRNPFTEISESSEYPAVPEEFAAHLNLSHTDLIRLADVPSVFDPLTPRPPLENWRLADSVEKGTRRFIDGLSQFLAPQDIQRLDQHLFAAGVKSARRVNFEAACVLTKERREAGTELVKFRCGEEDSSKNSSGSLFLRGRLYITGNASFEGRIEHLVLDGSDDLRDLKISGGGFEDGTRSAVRLSLVQEVSGMHARGANGNAIEAVRLSAPQLTRRARAVPQSEFPGQASVTVMEDFAPVAEAIRGIARATERNQNDAFSTKPFRRAVVMSALDEQLGLRVGDWCCIDDKNMPPPLAEKPVFGKSSQAHGKGGPAPLALFYQKCGACHGLSSPAPPNFLFGDSSQVKSQIAQCAERIYHRLDMWRLEPQQRPKTVMPPISDFQKMSLAQQTNLQAADVDAMKEYVAGILESAAGASSNWQEFLGRDYASLRPCLAEANESKMADVRR